jgi:hypothetical protein
MELSVPSEEDFDAAQREICYSTLWLRQAKLS